MPNLICNRQDHRIGIIKINQMMTSTPLNRKATKAKYKIKKEEIQKHSAAAIVPMRAYNKYYW